MFVSAKRILTLSSLIEMFSSSNIRVRKPLCIAFWIIESSSETKKAAKHNIAVECSSGFWLCNNFMSVSIVSRLAIRGIKSNLLLAKLEKRFTVYILYLTDKLHFRIMCERPIITSTNSTLSLPSTSSSFTLYDFISVLSNLITVDMTGFWVNSCCNMNCSKCTILVSLSIFSVYSFPLTIILV